MLDYETIGRLLIQNGSKINEKDNTGWIPLHTATRKGIFLHLYESIANSIIVDKASS